MEQESEPDPEPAKKTGAGKKKTSSAILRQATPAAGSSYLATAQQGEEKIGEELHSAHHEGEDEDVDEVSKHDRGYVVGKLVQHRPQVVRLVVPHQQPEDVQRLGEDQGRS